MSWYRKYRPQTISALHLLSVREELLHIMATGQIPHALLFTGPKGTGKTSAARILAKALNCENTNRSDTAVDEPCNECQMCIDITAGRSINVMEMDAASNRRIDDIRQLKEHIYTPPPSGKVVVYIVDEVHMLTNEAFNAFLKILEEPPAHAVFILATTEFHKLPDTIVSRCRVVQFQKASTAEIVSALSSVCALQQIVADEDALSAISSVADGSFRDGVKMLESVAQGVSDRLTLKLVESLLPSLQINQPEILLQAILSKDERAIVDFFATVIARDVDARFLHRQLLQFVHAEYLKSRGIKDGVSLASSAALQYIFKQFSQLIIDDRVPLPLISLEMTALEMVLKSKAQQSGSPGKDGDKSVATGQTQVKIKSDHQLPNTASSLEVSNSQPDQLMDQAMVSFNQSEVLSSSPELETKILQERSTSSLADGSELKDKWEELLRLIGARNLSLEALLRSSKYIGGEQGKARVQVFYQFHKQQLEVDRYRTIVQECVMQLLGGLVKIEYVLDLPSSNLEVLGSVDNNLSGSVSPEVAEIISLAEDALL